MSFWVFCVRKKTVKISIMYYFKLENHPHGSCSRIHTLVISDFKMLRIKSLISGLAINFMGKKKDNSDDAGSKTLIKNL